MNKIMLLKNASLKSMVIKTLVVTLVLITSCNISNRKTNNEALNNNLVNVMSIDSTFILDLKYATADNFLGKPVYKVAKCYLLKPVAIKLSEANKKFKKLGLRIKIYDGYRPHSVQKEMWKLVPNSMYVANPANGSSHNRGCAVDITLVDSLGNELIMPTGFDNFTERAHHDFMDLPAEAIKNRATLKRIMIESGFVPLSSEWWHYSTPNCKETVSLK